MVLVALTLIAILLYIQKREKESLLAFLFVVTGGMKFFPPTFIKSIDLALFYIIIVFIHIALESKNGYRVNESLKSNINNIWLLWGGFVLILIIIDQLFESTSITDSFKVLRSWLVLLVIPIINRLSFAELKWLIKATVYTTLVQLFLFILQPIFKFELTPRAIRWFDDGGVTVMRYINFPTYWPLALWYFSFTKSVKNKHLYILGILFAVAITLSRSLFLTIVAGYLFNILFLQSTSVKLKALVVAIALSFFALQFESPLQRRLITSVSEFSELQSQKIDPSHYSEGSGNIVFRANHLVERYLFISKDWRTYLFGIGFIHETNFHKKVFYIGLEDENGQVTQLDTGDVAWSLLIVRFGVLGLVLLMLINLRYIYFFKEYKRTSFGIIGFTYMASTIITSFAYPEIARAEYYIVPSIIVILILKKKEKDHEKNITHNLLA